MTPMTAQLAAALIKSFEGCRLQAYQDSGGVWTIGLGHTFNVKEGDVITYEQAEAYFGQDAAPLLHEVGGLKSLAGAAYVSFGYNCGRAPMVNAIEGRSKLADFVHDHHGNVLQGLVARRNLEWMLIQYDTGGTI